MTQNLRAAERYGTVKRLVFGYVCTFSALPAYLNHWIICAFCFFFQGKQSDIMFNYKYVLIHYIKFRIEVVEGIYKTIRADR